MSPRSKREPTVFADDPESRGAEESETLPVPPALFLGGMGQPMPDIELIEGLPTVIEGDFVPTDSTGPLLGDNATVESMLAYKEVSVTELFEDGSRGIRMYLGKPSLDTFDVMRRRSKGIGVVIEAEGVSVEHVK